MILKLPHLRLSALLAGSMLLFTLASHAALEDEVKAFEAGDRTNPPPERAILFVGSSTIRMWSDLPTAFPQHTVIKRGFGGSKMSDVLNYFDRLVTPYRPRLIVIYEGDNDLSSGKSVDEVFRDCTNFLGRVEADLPGTDVLFLSVKPSPSRAKLLPKMKELNERVRRLTDGRHTRFLDLFTPMLDASGQPRPELFRPDMLHLNKSGYELWRGLVGPALNAWALDRTRIDGGAAGEGRWKQE